MFSHLGLQNLVQDRLQKDRHSPIALQQLLDLLTVDLDLKSGQRRSVWLLLVGFNSNLAVSRAKTGSNVVLYRTRVDRTARPPYGTKLRRMGCVVENPSQEEGRRDGW
ncbi:hypothetical protein GGP94_003034 [Salinibacter ruber]|nr:hypothetical protein [Salinibacter ruber]